MTWKTTGADPEALYNGTEFPSLDLKFADNKTLVDEVSGDNLITFTRSSIGTYVDANGVIQTASTNTPRFDHDPVTGESLGLLIEEARTNLLTYSEEFDNAAWTKTGSPLAQVTPNQAGAPDGTVTADLLIDNAGRLQRNISAPSTSQYTLSLYIKSAGSSLASLWISSTSQARTAFDLSTESATIVSGTASIQNVGGGWYRCSVTTSSTISSSDTITVIINGDDCYIWGAQLEAGSFPTSYIPTSGSTVTRAADVAEITGSNFSSWYNQSEGTVFAECNLNYTPSSNAYVFNLSGTNAIQDRIAAYINSSTQAGWVVTTSAAAQAGAAYGDHLVPNGGKFILGYKVNDFAFDTSSGPIKTDTLGTPSSNTNTLHIATLSSGNSNLNAHISRLTYYPYRLSDTRLQTITT